GDGQGVGRAVGGGEPRRGGGWRDSGGGAAPLRQGRAAPRAEDGAPDRGGDERRRGAGARARGARGAHRRPVAGAGLVNVLVVGGTLFMGHELVFRLLAAGHRVTLLNRGTHEAAFRGRVERLLADRTTADFADRLKGRSFDAAVDFAAFTGEDARGVLEVLGGRVSHYVAISTGQVYLVRRDAPRPSREE